MAIKICLFLGIAFLILSVTFGILKTKSTILISGCACVFFIISLYTYNRYINKITTTNLSNIWTDNVVLNKNIKISPYDNIHTYNFLEDTTLLSINGITNLNKIKNIENILGTNFKDKWHNKEQGLRTHIYYDQDNNITANFIYTSYDEKLVLLKIQKTKK